MLHPVIEDPSLREQKKAPRRAYILYSRFHMQRNQIFKQANVQNSTVNHNKSNERMSEYTETPHI